MSMHIDDAKDHEIILADGDLKLKVSPYGASLRGLWREQSGADATWIITGYQGATGKVGGQGDVLIPFPGRVRDGRYLFEGATYQMPINDKDGPNAIHGFLRTVVWEIEAQTADSVRFGVDLRAADHEGYPFALRVTVAYAVQFGELSVAFTITNTGDHDAPVGAGFHPYFTVGSDHIDDDVLHIPMAATLEFENLLPTGRILPVDNTPFDFRAPRPIGRDVKLNTCYMGPARDGDGKLRIRLSAANDSRGVTLWLDESFDYVVVYSGDPLDNAHRRRSLAIEPMTCGSDAFNRPQFGRKVLAPGKSFSGTWGVRPGAAESWQITIAFD